MPWAPRRERHLSPSYVCALPPVPRPTRADCAQVGVIMALSSRAALGIKQASRAVPVLESAFSGSGCFQLCVKMQQP